MKSIRKKIAVLGATSHIAKTIIGNFAKTDQHQLILFARSPEKVRNFLVNLLLQSEIVIQPITEFGTDNYDVIINCVGIGNPLKLIESSTEIFRLTEQFDNLILDYVSEHQDSFYINFSSGAVYGTDFNNPAGESSLTNLNVNNISVEENYCIAKINSEAKHRAMPNFKIIDLRIFGYYSRFIDLNSKYLLTEILSCLKSGDVLLTNSIDIVRDYVHPSDLFSLIDLCISQQHLNTSLDVYSLSPIKKFDILNYFKTNYGLKYRVDNDSKIITATGIKSHYFSINKKAGLFGYFPSFTSLDTIEQETRQIINKLS